MPGPEQQAWCWVADCRPPEKRTVERLVRSLGLRTSTFESVVAVLTTGGHPGPEIALVHLNFTEPGGGLMLSWYLKHAYPGIRVLLYTGDPTGPAVSLVHHVGGVDALLDFGHLDRAQLQQLLPVLLAAARADRAASEALRPTAVPTPEARQRPLNLPQLHQALDETAIRLALQWRRSIRGAAKVLRIDRRTLESRMRKLGISEPGPDGN